MNKNLLFEIKGRSLELLAYAYEKRVLDKLRRDLVAFAVKAKRKSFSARKTQTQMKAIAANALPETDDKLIDAVAKDATSNLKLAEKHISDE